MAKHPKSPHNLSLHPLQQPNTTDKQSQQQEQQKQKLPSQNAPQPVSNKRKLPSPDTQQPAQIIQPQGKPPKQSATAITQPPQPAPQSLQPKEFVPDEGIKMSKKMKLLMVSSNPASNELVQLSSSTPPGVTTTVKPQSQQSHQQQQKHLALSALRTTATTAATAMTPSTTPSNPTLIEPKQSRVKVLTKAVIQRKTEVQPTPPAQVAIDKRKKIYVDLSAPPPSTTTSAASANSTHPHHHHQQQQQQQQQQSQPTLKAAASTKLQESLEKKMQGAQFRVLNEQLYTSDSAQAVALMQNEPELFEIYHQGFRTQVEKWPVNPLDIIITRLQGILKTKSCNLSANKPLIIADFGCGDARLAMTLGTHVNQLPFSSKTKSWLPATTTAQNNKSAQTFTSQVIGPNTQIYSFDLVAPSTIEMSLPLKSSPNTFAPVITSCDSADVSIPNNSVDCTIFCLSLMGTNFKHFLEEAHRVLKKAKTPFPNLIIAEVRSRFDEQQRDFGTAQRSKGATAGKLDVYDHFIKFVEEIGFSCLRMDKTNKMFVYFEFSINKGAEGNHKQKDARPVQDFVLKPCIYKRR